MILFSFLITVLFACFSSSFCQECMEWMAISPENYNQTFIAINHADANIVRPLGFKRDSLEFEGTPPCYTVNEAAGNQRHFEIKWELSPASYLCVEDSVSGTDPICDPGPTNTVCDEVPGGESSVSFTFLCTGQGCEGGTKTFWFRIVVEEPNEEGEYDENWCSTRDSQFPNGLAPLPVSLEPPTRMSTDPGRGDALKASTIVTFASILLGLLTFALGPL